MIPSGHSLTLRCAGGQACDEVFLGKYDKQQNGQELHRRGGEENAPFYTFHRSDYFGNDQWGCLRARGGKDEGEEKLVPCINDHEDGYGDHTLCG